MIYELHHPAAPLNHFIADIVFYADVDLPYDKEKLLPDGSIFLLMDMEDKPKRLFKNEDFSKYTSFSGTYLSGQHKKFIHIEVAKGSSMIVTRFKPGGFFPFVHFAVSALNNKVQQAEPILGPSIVELRKKIKAASTPGEKFALMENYLLSILKKDLGAIDYLRPAINFIGSNPEAATTKKLAELIGASQKHLISLFNKQVGLTPKSLARITRFQKVLQTLEKPETADWLQIATDCGYYDQAHFSKDFYEFSAINPSHYLNQKGEYLNFIPVSEA